MRGCSRAWSTTTSWCTCWIRIPPTIALLIDTERVVEIRNRKTHKLCLFIPGGYVDAKIGSFANSFFHFGLDQAFVEIARGELEHMPEDVRVSLRKVALVLRLQTKVTHDRWADYVSAVAASPSLATAGKELWRVGLLPDSGEDFAERLQRNRECMITLAYSSGGQSTLAQRTESLGLRPGKVRDELVSLLRNRRLREIDTWLPQLAAAPCFGTVSFDTWVFDDVESDIESIATDPILDAEGRVKKYTKLAQPLGPGTQPTASITEKAKVTVKWTCLPAKPSHLARWQLEVVPALGEYTDDEILGVDLPSVTVAGKQHSGSIPMHLDVDFEEFAVRSVQVRVSALDQTGAQLLDAEGRVVEAYSGEFWLTDEPVVADAPGARPATVPSFAVARLRAAQELDVDAFEEAAGKWEERDLHYFPMVLNGRRVSRVGLCPLLRTIEGLILSRPGELGFFHATVDDAGVLQAADLEQHGLPSLEGEAWSNFHKRRTAVFSTISATPGRDLVETVGWSRDLTNKVRHYAAAYRALLSSSDPNVASAALSIDTLEVTLLGRSGSTTAMLVSPTHPLRMLWYASYAELLGSWEALVLAAGKDKRRAIDAGLIERLAPNNVPALGADGDGAAYLFAQNIRFFWGLLLPVGASDPVRLASDLARAIGLPSEDVGLLDLPPARLAAELRTYADIHPYLQTLRLNAVNAGSGNYLAAALSKIYMDKSQAEDDEAWRPPRLDLNLYTEGEPAPVPAITSLQEAIYAQQPSGGRRYLDPFFSYSVRRLRADERLPGDDVNVSLVSDYLSPRLDPLEDQPAVSSASLYGLLVRMLPEFETTEAGCRWRYCFSFPETGASDKHPVAGWLSSELIDTQREQLLAVARLAIPQCVSCGASIAVEIGPDERLLLDSMHAQSDWVVTLDRYLGAEFYDDPSDVNIGSVARKYLLDYSPEFLDGLGHRMLVTTSHRNEIEEVLSRAMVELGFQYLDENTAEVLDRLKMISGRLVLRVVGDDSHAREAVSLGVVVACLKARGELQDSILVPIDAHPELFGLSASHDHGGAKLRCDLMLVKLVRGKLIATFIEVKSRSSNPTASELLSHIADQVKTTDRVFRDLFFRQDPQRVDHALQRARLVTLLEFYLRRAQRHGLITSPEAYEKLQKGLTQLEGGVPKMSSELRGFVVNLTAEPRAPFEHDGVVMEVVTAQEAASAGLSTVVPPQVIYRLRASVGGRRAGRAADGGQPANGRR